MKKLYILTAFLIITLILLTTLLLALTSSNLSGLKISSNSNIFSHTKAICNSTNFCQDYEIHCENEKIIKMSPITGAAVQFSSEWTDPRDEKTIKNMG